MAHEFVGPDLYERIMEPRSDTEKMKSITKEMSVFGS
jgi:hypothetical protein